MCVYVVCSLQKTSERATKGFVVHVVVRRRRRGSRRLKVASPKFPPTKKHRRRAGMEKTTTKNSQNRFLAGKNCKTQRARSRRLDFGESARNACTTHTWVRAPADPVLDSLSLSPRKERDLFSGKSRNWKNRVRLLASVVRNGCVHNLHTHKRLFCWIKFCLQTCNFSFRLFVASASLRRRRRH